jgi:hypothetical protein
MYDVECLVKHPSHEQSHKYSGNQRTCSNHAHDLIKLEESGRKTVCLTKCADVNENVTEHSTNSSNTSKTMQYVEALIGFVGQES